MQGKSLVAVAACSLIAIAPAYAGDPQSVDTPPTGTSPQEQADVQALVRQLQELKASYAQEMRRMRELDMRVQALQAKLTGKVAPNAPLPAQPTTATAQANAEAPNNVAATSPDNGTAGSPGEASKAQQDQPSRSMEDALQQDHGVFNHTLTIENGLTYDWYDRRQLTLNGFLALDAIFLGNLALQDVKSDILTWDTTVRYRITPDLTLSVDVPYMARRTAFIQGGAQESAATLQQESSSGKSIGDITLMANYRLFNETVNRPDTVLTLGVVTPTGTSPYNIAWVTPGGTANNTNGNFAIPDKQPTGNGLWEAQVGVSMVKTMDPAIVFANLGYIHAFPRAFANIDTSPDTETPGAVQLGDSYTLGAGVAFAFNDRTSLSLAFSDKFSAMARLRTSGQPWIKIIGSDANAGMLNLGVTYALSAHTTIVTMLGIGLTPDAPNYMLNFKVPYMF